MSIHNREGKTIILRECPLCGYDDATIERVGTQRASMVIVCQYCGLRSESGDTLEIDSWHWKWNQRPVKVEEKKVEIEEKEQAVLPNRLEIGHLEYGRYGDAKDKGVSDDAVVLAAGFPEGGNVPHILAHDPSHEKEGFGIAIYPIIELIENLTRDMKNLDSIEGLVNGLRECTFIPGVSNVRVIAAILGVSLGSVLDTALNYVEVVVEDPHTHAKYLMNIRRFVEGFTPHQLRQQAETELEKMKRQVEMLEGILELGENKNDETQVSKIIEINELLGNTQNLLNDIQHETLMLGMAVHHGELETFMATVKDKGMEILPELLHKCTEKIWEAVKTNAEMVLKIDNIEKALSMGENSKEESETESPMDSLLTKAKRRLFNDEAQ